MTIEPTARPNAASACPLVPTWTMTGMARSRTLALLIGPTAQARIDLHPAPRKSRRRPISSIFSPRADCLLFISFLFFYWAPPLTAAAPNRSCDARDQPMLVRTHVRILFEYSLFLSTCIADREKHMCKPTIIQLVVIPNVVRCTVQ
jgi:hypothetical protein